MRIPGFHPEFAKPTFVLVRALLVVFSVILIYPYFRVRVASLASFGICRFAGVARFIKCYCQYDCGVGDNLYRPFKVGDRIKIDGIVGDVTEKNMLVTKIKQVTNEEVTIPNSKVLNSNTINP